MTKKTILNQSRDASLPNKVINTEKLFGFQCPFPVLGYKDQQGFQVEVDKNYCFDQDTVLAILAGFAFNRRVMLSGFHGTGKSSHIEQVAARLNWPCLRINLDSHVSRIDLIGKDAIVLENNQQITKFQEGILPFALQKNIALVLDEYDAGRADVMFVLQRVLEDKGKLTLLEQNKIINPHPAFRLFATTNTIGLGDMTGLYHGTQQINQAQMDRWSLVATLNYLPKEKEKAIALAKFKNWKKSNKEKIISQMIELATFTRQAFQNGDLSTLMSPRTVFLWIENLMIFKNIDYAFRLTFLNKCDNEEKPIITEFYQRIFDHELKESAFLEHFLQ